LTESQGFDAGVDVSFTCPKPVSHCPARRARARRRPPRHDPHPRV